MSSPPSSRMFDEEEATSSTPLLAHRSAEEAHPTSFRPSASLSFFSAYALLVGSQIGSGIFSSTSSVASHVPSPGGALLVWIASGGVAWAGATTLAELGAALPRNGGMQEYLRAAWGDGVAAVMGWIWVVALKPAAMGIQSIVFAQYWLRAMRKASLVGENGSAILSSEWREEKLLAVAGLLAICAVNAIGGRASAKFTDVLLFIKLAAFVLVGVLALLVVTKGLNAEGDGPNTDWKEKNWFEDYRDGDGSWADVGLWAAFGHYTAAAYACLWAYSGWDLANFVAGEMKNTARDLPRAVHAGIPTVAIAFVMANVAYYVTLPWRQVDTENAIAVAAAQKVVGHAGGMIFAFLVSASCLGALNINVFAVSRLTVEAARHGYLPRILIDHEEEEESSNAGTSPKDHGSPSDFGSWAIRTARHVWAQLNCRCPIAAMIFNVAITSVFIFAGTFGELVTFIGLAEFTFFLLTAVGSLWMKRSQPDLHRPYKPPVWIPCLFIMACALLVLRGAVFAPVQASILVFLILAGSALHFKKASGRYETVT